MKRTVISATPGYSYRAVYEMVDENWNTIPGQWVLDDPVPIVAWEIGMYPFMGSDVYPVPVGGIDSMDKEDDFIVVFPDGRVQARRGAIYDSDVDYLNIKNKVLPP